MLNRTTRFTALLLTLCLVSVSLTLAQPSNVPHRYNPFSLDGTLVTLTNPLDGRTWSVWAYRSGAEYDIAVSYKDQTGFWSEPLFFGRDDRRDQVQPAMTVDPAGNLYVTYVERSSGAVMLTALPVGGAWLEPAAVTEPGERGYMPALSVVGNRLVVAFRSGRTILIRDLPLLPSPTAPGAGIQDGPDPVGENGGSGSSGQPVPGTNK